MYLQCRGSRWENHRTERCSPQCYLRAAELKMRAAEEPPRTDLDVKGIKAQVLGRLEEPGARERERKVLLSEVAVMADEHRFDVSALEAVLGG
jgi:hypothetical protein